MPVPAAPTGIVTAHSPSTPGRQAAFWNTQSQDAVLFFFAYWDNMRPVNCGGGANNSNTSPVLHNGTHTVQVSAVNASGESSLSAPVSFVISDSPLDGAESTLVALADSLVNALNQAQTQTPSPFVLPFTPQRKFVPIIDLKDVKDGDAPIVLFGPATDNESRLGGGNSAVFTGDYAVSCMIYWRVGAGDPAEALCAKVMLLRNQIRNYFKNGVWPVAGPRATAAVLDDIEGEPAFGENTLIQKNCFASMQIFKFVVPV